MGANVHTSRMANMVRTTGGGDALLDAVRRHTQIPGLGTAVARVVAMVNSNVDSIQELRNVILADVHLTQRIIGIANSVGYKLNSGAGVTTVTRAIVVVGFEQVKLLALGMMFVDQLPDKARALAMETELIGALQASLLAREMSRHLTPEDQEKASIAALLGNVGRLLLVMIDLDRFQEIARRVNEGATEADATYEILGMTLNTLTNEILKFWGIPGSLVSLSAGTVAPTEPTGIRRLDRIVTLAKATAQHLRHRDPAEREALIADTRKKCLEEGGTTGPMFDRWISSADAQMAPIRALLEASTQKPAAEDVFPEGSLIADSEPLAGRLNAVGKPANSNELVLAGLEDLTRLITEQQNLSAIFMAALECLHTGFGFTRSILLLRDAGTPKIRARVWCGAVTKAQAEQLVIDIDAPGDLLATAIRRGSDLQIQNSLAPAFAQRLPPYLSNACPQMTSFILLPLHADNSQIACILVGRDQPEPEPISAGDMRLLRTVRGQIILAMKAAR